MTMSTNKRALRSNAAGDEDVLELIHTVMHQYRSLQFRLLRDGAHDITQMEHKVLSFFERNPGATQSALAEHSGRDKAQLARLIKGLRERALLAAEADPKDRRNVHLALTPHGAALQRQLIHQAKKLSAQAVAGFSAQERKQLSALLMRVSQSLDEEDRS